MPEEERRRNEIETQERGFQMDDSNQIIEMPGDIPKLTRDPLGQTEELRGAEHSAEMPWTVVRLGNPLSEDPLVLITIPTWLI